MSYCALHNRIDSNGKAYSRDLLTAICDVLKIALVFASMGTIHFSTPPPAALLAVLRDRENIPKCINVCDLDAEYICNEVPPSTLRPGASRLFRFICSWMSCVVSCRAPRVVRRASFEFC